MRSLTASLHRPAAAAVVAGAPAEALQAARGVMTSLSAAQEAATKAHAEAGSLAAALGTGSAAPAETEVRMAVCVCWIERACGVSPPICRRLA